MDFLESLAALTPRSLAVDSDFMGPAYVQDDVCHALALATDSKLESYYVRIVFAQQYEFIKDFTREFLICDAFTRLVWEGGWTRKKGFRPGLLTALILLAVDEKMDDRCRKCRGKGEVPKRTKSGWVPGPCPRCGGTGRKRRTDSSRAERLEMHYLLYRNTWKSLYREILRIMGQMDADVSRRGTYRMMIV